MASSCTASGRPAAAETAPSMAPPTVPRLKAAWSRGISERPRRRSTSAPSTFIATSQTPMPSPVTARPTAAATTAPARRPPASPTRPPATASDPPSDGARGADAMHDRPRQRESGNGARGEAEEQKAEPGRREPEVVPQRRRPAEE